MVEDFFIKKNDRLPYYTAIIRDRNGAMDLSGLTIAFTMKNLSTLSVTISLASASLTTGVTGGVEYHWAIADCAVPGEYGVEFKVTTAGGTITVPKGFTAKVIIEDTYA
jgi:hypothetical protein